MKYRKTNKCSCGNLTLNIDICSDCLDESNYEDENGISCPQCDKPNKIYDEEINQPSG